MSLALIKMAPIAGEEEEEAETEEDEDEEEYTYETYEEEEETAEDPIEELNEPEEEAKGAQTRKGEEEEWRRWVEVAPETLERESRTVHLRSLFWVPCAERAFRACQLVQEHADGTTVTVEPPAEEGGEERPSQRQKAVSRDCLQPMSVSHLCADMCQLSELNEPSVLECIRTRYEDHKLIHTYSGLFCVVVNPWRQMPALYSAQVREQYAARGSDLPPHVFSIAQSAHDGVCAIGGGDQSILITGESGAGKTENTKRIIEYLIDVAGRGVDTAQGSSVDAALVSAGTALEAFANAQTVHNNNSSRLGKFIRIDFDAKGALRSARIDCYLLEKSRVVSQNEGDRNFHVFYRLFAEPLFLASEKAEAVLSRLWTRRNGGAPRAEAFRFLNQGKAAQAQTLHAKFVDDVDCARETEVALEQLGLDRAQKGWVRELVTACVLVGEIRFGERQGMDMSFVEEMAEVEAVAELLGVRSSPLVDALTQPSIRVGDALIRRTQPLRKTLSSAQSLAKCVYERLFEWLVAKCNAAIGGTQAPGAEAGGRFVGVLDMAGFEIMSRNSFEQLCINYTNERLQQFFNEFMFVREQHEYRREGIRWEQQDYGRDLQPTIDVIEKPLGILSLLQEECIVPNGSDQSLLDKLDRHLAKSASGVFCKAKQSSRCPALNHFTVAHYAGPVSYNVDGWLEKNRDAVDWSLLEVLAASEHPLVGQLFAGRGTAAPTTRKGPAMAQASISFLYREQLAQLLRTLNATAAHFIRCIVPNHERTPFALNGPLAVHQLRCNGVLEGIRICRRGYPNRVPFAAFLARFRLLSPSCCTGANDCADPRTAVERLCAAVNLDPESFQLGRTKLFCRVGLISGLEAKRTERLARCISALQAHIRWAAVQRDARRRREEWECVVTIQCAVRRHVHLRRWAWFRLWLKVRQLIPLAAQRRRLAELEAENAELAAKRQKAQGELDRASRELREWAERAEKWEAQRAEERRQTSELRSELRRNEEVLERMEAKFDEQHSKIVRLNGTLGEHTKALERMEEERNSLRRELDALCERHRAECIERESAEEALRMGQEEIVRLRQEADEMLAEIGRLGAERARREEELAEAREHAREQEEQLAELNRTLAEANDRLGEMQPQLHAEKSARRKAEAIAEEFETELARAIDEVDKANVKRDAQKEQLRAREVQVRKLERKLEDKCAEMEECVAELRRTHKRGQTELQEQLEEWRRKCLRLETENAQLKCRLEAQAALEGAAGASRSASRGGTASRFGSSSALDRDHRESSADSDCGGGPGGLARSVTARHAFNYPGSLHRRRHQQQLAPMSDPLLDHQPHSLHRSASGASSVGNLSSLPSSTSSSLRRTTLAQSANPMITSLTTTVDSGLLTRSPSSASTVSGSLMPAAPHSQYLSLAQRVDAAERRALGLERELHAQRQDAQMTKRELEVYKQSLQESERTRDSLAKQTRSLNADLESMGRALKAEEERAQTMEFEARKQTSECTALRQKLEEEREETRGEREEERKRHAEKLAEMAHEFDSRLRQLANSQRTHEQLQSRLADAESALDKALAQLSHMERLQKTQSAIGETWESQYRSAQQDLESARDENAALKSRIRRQQRQIELLTQQSELDSQVSALEERVDRFGRPPRDRDEDAESGGTNDVSLSVTLFSFSNNNC